jgi:hypothetical protein
MTWDEKIQYLANAPYEKFTDEQVVKISERVQESLTGKYARLLKPERLEAYVTISEKVLERLDNVEVSERVHSSLDNIMSISNVNDANISGERVLNILEKEAENNKNVADCSYDLATVIIEKNPELVGRAVDLVHGSFPQKEDYVETNWEEDTNDASINSFSDFKRLKEDFEYDEDVREADEFYDKAMALDPDCVSKKLDENGNTELKDRLLARKQNLDNEAKLIEEQKKAELLKDKRECETVIADLSDPDYPPLKDESTNARIFLDNVDEYLDKYSDDLNPTVIKNIVRGCNRVVENTDEGRLLRDVNESFCKMTHAAGIEQLPREDMLNVLDKEARNCKKIDEESLCSTMGVVLNEQKDLAAKAFEATTFLSDTREVLMFREKTMQVDPEGVNQKLDEMGNTELKDKIVTQHHYIHNEATCRFGDLYVYRGVPQDHESAEALFDEMNKVKDMGIEIRKDEENHSYSDADCLKLVKEYPDLAPKAKKVADNFPHFVTAEEMHNMSLMNDVSLEDKIDALASYHAKNNGRDSHNNENVAQQTNKTVNPINQAIIMNRKLKDR